MYFGTGAADSTTGGRSPLPGRSRRSCPSSSDEDALCALSTRRSILDAHHVVREVLAERIDSDLVRVVQGRAAPVGPAGELTTRIVQAELELLRQLDAPQAVRRLRARWLTTRAGNGQEPVLYVERPWRGSSDEVRFIRADDVRQMEFLNGSDAITRFRHGSPGPQLPSARAKVSSTSAHVRISSTRIHSSSVCACSMPPGP